MARILCGNYRTSDQALRKTNGDGSTGDYDLFLGVAVTPSEATRVRWGISAVDENQEFFGTHIYTGNDGEQVTVTPGHRGRRRYRALEQHAHYEHANGRSFAGPDFTFVY